MLAIGGQAAGRQPQQRSGRQGQLACGGVTSGRPQVGSRTELELEGTLRSRRDDGDRRVLLRAGVAWGELADEADHHRQPIDEQRGGGGGDLGRRVVGRQHVPGCRSATSDRRKPAVEAASIGAGRNGR